MFNSFLHFSSYNGIVFIITNREASQPNESNCRENLRYPETDCQQ